MFKLKLFVIALCILSFSGINAEVYGTMIGGEPYASWEDGGQDFFVMFNSNIDDNVKLFGDDDVNPQGDTCVDSSSFTLTDFHIPTDAIIEKAYIIWMGAVDPSKIDSPTDNTVKLSFSQAGESPVTYEQDIAGADDGVGNGKLLTDTASFEFEGMKFTDDVEVGCTETASGSIEKDQDLGYFTYRVDITDFFQKIAEENATAEKPEDGMYYGDYTFSGLDCTEHDNYRCKTTMVSAWSVFFVYRSKNIRPKKIYLYNGLAFVQGDKSVAKVSGFELPKYPVVRLTSMIAEGDPSLKINPSLPPEGVFLQGDGATSLFRLYNDCNPMQGNYVEVFNSISSVVNWDPEAEEANQTQCVSGPEDATINFGIDVDTFLLNSEENINLQEHLKKGNTAMDITLSVNQDAIFTNFMVLSVDNKGSNFDIPAEASDTSKSKWNFPLDREKHFCGCPSSDDGKTEDYYCEETTGFREFYYMIKIQNWGDEDAENIVVSDDLDEFLEYIPGTTEYATHLVPGSTPDQDKYDDWELIPDKDGGAFPLSGTGYKIAAKMANCDQDSWTCADTIMVRYKVKPKAGTSKNYVFENIAVISDDKSEEPYKSNRSYPLKLAPTICVPDTQCPSPKKADCGGEKIEENCNDSNPCPDGFICQEGECEDDSTKTCLNSTAAFTLGKNSPISEGSEIVIPKDNNKQPLIVGQFTLRVSNCTEDKYYNLDAVTVNFDKKGDQYIKFSDLELINDVNGNGVVDPEDKVLSTGELADNYAKFYVPVKSDETSASLALKKFKGDVLNYFIIRTMVDYTEEEIKTGTTFNFYLESASSVEISDLGTSFVEANEIEFASYMLEPTGDFFVVTVGPNDPPVPALTEMNKDIPVLQLRTKALTKANTVSSLKVKVPTAGGYVKFGEKNGIEAISLYLDSSKDGVGNVKVAEITEFDAITTTIIFDNFLQNLSYLSGEEKYLVVYLKLNMVSTPEGEKPLAAKIEIPNGGISLSDRSVDTVELPIRSKEFVYECEEGDVSCVGPEPEPEGGCSCSVVSVDSNESSMMAFIIVAVLSIIMGSFFILRKQS